MKRRAVLAVALAFAAWPPAAQADYFLECESGDYRYTYCAADTRSGVELDEQKSSASCTINESWGYDAGGVWVDQGCRGRFHILASGSAPEPGGGSAAAGLIAPDVLGPLEDDDAEDGRDPGFGRADAVRACALFADREERGRGAVAVLVESVEQVIPRGRRAYDVKFTVAVQSPRGSRPAPATCSVQDGAVGTYNRF